MRPFRTILIILGVVIAIFVLILINAHNTSSRDYQNSPGDGSDGLPVLPIMSNETMNETWIHAYHAGLYYVYYQNENNTIMLADDTIIREKTTGE